ncbi:MAG: histidine phosphatase family protein [Oceanospirillaceae bacterium]|nr:histidine phosphatase family protein [Oceanospirillaceae bacterium]
MAELFLVRHGQASFGADDYDQLSSLGEQQAFWLGQYFADRDIEFDKIIIGTQLRHQQTAEHLCRGLDHVQTFDQHAGLNEYDFYAITEAMEHQYPQLMSHGKGDKRSYYKALKQALELWSSDQLDAVPETWQRFMARVADALQFIQQSNAKRVLVVSSGGPIAALTHQVLACPTATAIELNMQIRNTSVCHCFFNRESIRLASFNNIPHLDQPDRMDAITYG